jgi:hypothetical protein
MGFNAVHILPITRLDTSESPYAAKDLFEIDDCYLDPTDKRDGHAQLDAFVARARELGLRLCFDLVLNHVGVTSTMVQRAPDWIVPDASSPDGNKRAGYWSETGWRSWEDLALINYEHPSIAVRAEIYHYMTQYALFWARYASETDGLLRFDNLHSSNPDFVKAMVQSLHEAHPNVAILAEHFADDSTLLTTVPEWRLNLVLATPWSQKYVPELREYLRYIHHLSDRIRYCMPITSHDSGSPAQEFASPEATVPRYVAAALLGTGATGITQGVEWAAPERINFIGRTPRRPSAEPSRFAPFIKAVNDILEQHVAFRRGGTCEFVDKGHAAIIAAYRRDVDPASDGYLVLCNFDILGPQKITCDLSALVPHEALLGRELLTGQEMSFESAAVSLTLPTCGAMVWQLRAAVP